MAPSSLEKGEAENFEHVSPNRAGSPPRKRGFGTRLKRHCAKYWWAHLLITCIIVLAVTLGICFGAFPHLAQKAINDSTIEVDAISITQPAPDSFTYGQNATLRGHVPVKSHLDPQTISMYLVSSNASAPIVPFMALNVSRKDLKSHFPVDVAGYPMKILDQKAFNDFTTAFLTQPSIMLGLQSHPELWAGALHKVVNYHKEVNLTGINHFNGIAITNPQVLKTPESDGTNMLADLYIPNPSVFTIEVGDLVTNFAMPPVGPLGYGIVKDLILKPGDNHVQVRSVLTDTAYKLVPLSLGSPGPLNLTVTGNATIYNGVHIPWLEGPLSSVPLTVPLYTKVNATTH